MSLKMSGLREAAAETRCIRECSGDEVQIMLNTETGIISTEYFVGGNWWVCVPYPEYISIFANRRMTMKEIHKSLKNELELSKCQQL